jgi:ABC-type Fe3+/spermidine/putrescine transport system ATPase subunit
LLLDEPIGALDKKLREQMLLEFRRIHRILGTTMVYVTHDQEEALIMSDRVAVMNRGRIVRLGTPRDLYENPVDPFVANFLGETNVLAGAGSGNCAVVVEQSSWVITITMPVPRGSRVRIAVRPEKIVIGAPPPGWNSTRGRIEEVVYAGEVTKYRVKVPSGHILFVKEMNRQQTPVYEIGMDVYLAWHPADGRVLGGNEVG